MFDILTEREQKGEIRNIKRQQQVVLQEGNQFVRITWRVDFSFERVSDGVTCYAEAKGVETPEYVLKLKLWRAKKPAPLEIWKGSYKNPFLAECV